MSAENTLPEGATLNPDGTVNYDLRWPIAFKRGGAEVTLSTVTVRRKKLADNLAIKKIDNGVDIACELIVRLCGIERPVAVEIDDVDSEAIGAIIESFTTPGQPTGKPAQQ